MKRIKQFNVGDKIILNKTLSNQCGLGKTKIREAMVIEPNYRGSSHMVIKRGTQREKWHINYWRKTNI